MKIILKNEAGSFELGGGRHPQARLQEITGLGVPAKEHKTAVLEGQAGQTLNKSRDLERTITMSFDFFGDERTVRRLYKIIYEGVSLYFYLSNGERRRITGYCTRSTEAERIIYHKWQSIALQFLCYDPYFYDFYDTTWEISKKTDQWPNSVIDGAFDITIPSRATLISNEASVYVNGDIRTYPVITIKKYKVGTSENTISLMNNTTGRSIVLNYGMAENELLTINLPKRIIESSLNGDITSCISDDTVLSDFYLLRGSNDISISADEDIFAELSIKNQYMSVVI